MKISNNVYTGGSVELYKPSGENLYHYDINSLYPYVMANFPMPVGSPTFVEGDLLKLGNLPYGFYLVNVNVSENIRLKHPILQIKVKYNGIATTISPTGSWSGWYSHYEINLALSLGYQIEVIKGYKSESENIFKDFVATIYTMKQNSQPNTSRYVIAKLLLNSLSGRFGMNPNLLSHIIISEDFLLPFMELNNVVNKVDLQNGKFLVSHTINNNNSSNFTKNYIETNVSVGVSAMITSLGRCVMARYKNLDDDSILLYTDTDSLIRTTPLPDNLIGGNLGQFKLEAEYMKAVFISPKLYAGVTKDNNEIVKAKGVSKMPNFVQLESLLVKNSIIQLPQEKWYRNLSLGHIKILDQIINIRVTDNKRNLIYQNNKFIDTKPIQLRNGEVFLNS